MQVKTHIKASRIAVNHNETLIDHVIRKIASR